MLTLIPILMLSLPDAPVSQPVIPPADASAGAHLEPPKAPAAPPHPWPAWPGFVTLGGGALGLVGAGFIFAASTVFSSRYYDYTPAVAIAIGSGIVFLAGCVWAGITYTHNNPEPP
jgi:hypothetical protein